MAWNFCSWIDRHQCFVTPFFIVLMIGTFAVTFCVSMIKLEPSPELFPQVPSKDDLFLEFEPLDGRVAYSIQDPSLHQHGHSIHRATEGNYS